MAFSFEDVSDTELPLAIGNTFYTYNGGTYKNYVVAILKNEKIPQIIYRYFGKHKQWWHYTIESIYGFNLSFRSELYTVKRKK